MLTPPSVLSTLTRAQRDAIVCVGAGAVSYRREPNTSVENGSFSSSSIAGFYYSRYWPMLSQPTATCQNLLKRGLLRLPDQNYQPVALTPEGEAVFEAVLTDAERDGRARQIRGLGLEAKAKATKERVASWNAKHADELNALRDASFERRSSAHRLRGRIMEVALLLGNGANDVDGLVAELRACTQDLNALEVQATLAEQQSNALDEKRKRETDDVA